MSIQHECIQVNSEIPSAVFVGAAATLAHLGWRARRTFDLDIAVAIISEVDEKRLLNLNYLKIGTQWYTPRKWKIDIYKNDVGDFPIDQIRRDAVEMWIKKSRIRVTNLEMLILMKHRAGQTEDLRNLVRDRFDLIKWDYMQSIAKNDVELDEMKNVARSLGLLK